jgi:hypothetical protein
MVYLLIGASMVAAALSIFASSAVAKSHSWYQDLLKEEEKNSVDATLYTKLKDVVMLNIESIKVIGSWFLMIIILTVWSLSSINQWSFAEALYFAVSSLSTGGLFAIPNESPDWYFGFGKTLPFVCDCFRISYLIFLYVITCIFQYSIYIYKLTAIEYGQ